MSRRVDVRTERRALLVAAVLTALAVAFGVLELFESVWEVVAILPVLAIAWASAVEPLRNRLPYRKHLWNAALLPPGAWMLLSGQGVLLGGVFVLAGLGSLAITGREAASARESVDA